MNKILLLFLIAFLVSCGASKPKAPTKKVAQISRKGVSNKPVAKLESKEFKNGFPSNSKTEILEATQKIKVTQEMVLNYIANFKTIAKENMTSKGIPASITLAQGILESGAGTGDLALQANNHFGIKCHKEWTGESVRHDDDSPQECFRKYNQPEQSYRDHCAFLTSRPWYSPLFLLPKNDYKAWAKGLKKSGYATDVKYPQKLIGIIERYQLQQYDAEVLGIEYVEESKSAENTEAEVPTNVSETYVVIKGDTLYSISKKFNLTIEDLKRKNNLSENGLALGQTLNVK
ncbi:glucosaminidase domain-containing protein [Flavobacterium sp.]|uniref:glucosaminidase domain-containing protein n=1 Tax=Flavobacterium sp. TaxID=239 RepID=UPI00286CEFD8|nr:glucosaminidase domain-containing protein [Flavobacterium sp.]